MTFIDALADDPGAPSARSSIRHPHKEAPNSSLVRIEEQSISSCQTISTIGSEWTARSIKDEHGHTFASHLTLVADRKRWEMHQSVIDVIGQTPIIRLQRLGPKNGTEIYVKCENMNPGGSLKDRLALGIIEWAEKTGRLKAGQTVIEASSGNTGM